jgi:bacillithiol synthase
MPCSCVRQTDLPHTTRLFADAVYNPERVAAFYPHPFHGLETYRTVAREAELPPGRRAALVAALRALNGGSPSLDLLAQPGTVAVVTGQQVGLFSGPSYTVYKALTAARLARHLTENGIPAVPVFWLATEDHDFAEVNHVWMFDAAHRASKLEMKRGASTQPVGEVTLTAPPVRELRDLLQGLPFGEEVADLAQDTYRPGATMGRAFGEMLRELLKDYGILQVDPMFPAFRELAAPALRTALDRAPRLTERVLERDRALAAAGYHAQVHVEPQTSFVFLLEDGKRLALRRHERDYILNSRRFSTEELMERAAGLSPNALLRPVIQDSMLPAVAYVGGPAEVAYLAQSAVLYEEILGHQPIAVARAGFTLLDSRSDRLLERYALRLPDFYRGDDGLRERLAARLVPPSVQTAMSAASATVDAAVAGLNGKLASFDPTLVAALERSSRKVRYQFEKMSRKVGREALLRDARAAADAASLYGLIYPERHLQERLYSILPFVAKHGFDLIGKIYESIDLDCPDHRVLVV